MHRRDFIVFTGGWILAMPFSASARSAPKVYRVGSLNTGAPANNKSPFGAALLRGLAQYGYVPDENFTFEPRGADMHLERLPQLVDELRASKVDVVFVLGYPAALAMKGTSIPVVSWSTGDPVATGLVESLARPGGNITGISDVSAEVTPKRLGLLREIVPGMRRVAMLYNAADLGMTLRYRAAAEAAKAMGVTVQPLGVREPNDFEHAFAAMSSETPDAILMVSDALTALNRKRVFEFAAAHGLPAIYEYDSYVRDGGLMSYGPDFDESFARAAALVDHILKGAKPSELPFEQPTLFRFAINLKTAQALGLSLSASLVALADEVIE
jgi:putative tryptophan/tyrosine transport system substrate-binding protein